MHYNFVKFVRLFVCSTQLDCNEFLPKIEINSLNWFEINCFLNWSFIKNAIPIQYKNLIESKIQINWFRLNTNSNELNWIIGPLKSLSFCRIRSSTKSIGDIVEITSTTRDSNSLNTHYQISRQMFFYFMSLFSRTVQNKMIFMRVIRMCCYFFFFYQRERKYLHV